MLAKRQDKHQQESTNDEPETPELCALKTLNDKHLLMKCICIHFNLIISLSD